AHRARSERLSPLVRPRARTYVAHSCVCDAAGPAIYTLSLHDALPISSPRGEEFADKPRSPSWSRPRRSRDPRSVAATTCPRGGRSEEHTSELQSQSNLVCRLLLEKKKKT